MARKPTRNAQGSGTIRHRADGRWEARYTVGRDPGTGKQVQKSVYGKTQQEVRKKLIAATSAIDDGIYIEPSKMTFGQWLDIWLSDFCGNVKPKTRELYRGSIEYRIKPALGKQRLLSLNTAMIQHAYNDALQGTKDKPGVSPKTVKNLHGIVHKALKQAVEAGYIRYNPADACKLPRIEKPQIKPLGRDELGRFLEAIKGDPFERLFLVTLFTGIREGEVLGLPWDCVDFEKGTILIRQQLQLSKGQYNLVPLKNDRPRTITPAPFVMDILRQQKAAQAEQRLKIGSIWIDSGFVFTNEIGDHLSRHTVYKHFKKAVEVVGVPSARFHDLRHTFAVASLESGDDIKTVQENLGHATASFTLDVYGHVSERMKQESAQRMQNFINSLGT